MKHDSDGHAAKDDARNRDEQVYERESHDDGQGLFGLTDVW